MHTYLVLRRRGWATPLAFEKAAGVCARVGNQEMPDRVRWIRSYVIREPDGGVGTVCIFQGTNPDAIREHARRAGMPADAIIPVGETVIINDDPLGGR